MRRGEQGADDRVAKALRICQNAMRELLPTHREQVMRGPHAWYTFDAESNISLSAEDDYIPRDQMTPQADFEAEETE